MTDYIEITQGGAFLGSMIVDEGFFRATEQSDCSWGDGVFGLGFEIFGCAGAGLAGYCLDSNLNSYLTVGVGAPGVAAGATQDASDFLVGHGVNAILPNGIGAGASIFSDDGAVLLGSPGASYGYGIEVAEFLRYWDYVGQETSDGLYDMVGRPYDPPADLQPLYVFDI